MSGLFVRYSRQYLFSRQKYKSENAVTHWMLNILNGRQSLVCTLWCGEWPDGGAGDCVVGR